ITVAPGLLLANGTDTSLVTVTARQALGQPVPDGTPIVFAAGEKFADKDANGIWTPGIDSLVFDVNGNGNWDAMGQIPSSIPVSGGTGQAQAVFVAGNSAGTVYVKATIGDETIGGSADKALQLSPNARISSILLHSDSINLAVRATGGMETAVLSATAYDGWGNPVPEGLPISFIITDGPGGGERLDTAGYGPYSAVTNSQGTAQAPIQSGTAAGTVRIRAYCDTILSNAAQVMVSAGPPAHLVVGADVCNIDYWDNVGREVGIVAVVSDVYMNPVVDNTAVYFTTDEGSMKSHEARTRDLEGVASTVWISGTQAGVGADGQVMVAAETAGGTVVDTCYFINSHLPDTIWAAGVPGSILADGASKAVVWVSAADLGNFVLDGTPFEADANYLQVEAGTLEDGCNMSSARVKITSSTLSNDFSLTGGQDNGIGAVDIVYYWSGGAMAAYPVSMLTGTAYTANCMVTSGPAKVGPGEQARYSVEIRDRFGNPLGDHTIVLSASGGTVSGISQETNGNGEAGGFVWTAPAAPGDVNLTFTDTDPRGGVILSYKVTVE
ncbi:MAG TPA: Ig-like domain-containing protein, partial [candidate division Zixibacteria bacterium]|nr:Ig-like domain-containing protein [candidate division Zixibacteria bacterium]